MAHVSTTSTTGKHHALEQVAYGEQAGDVGVGVEPSFQVYLHEKMDGIGGTTLGVDGADEDVDDGDAAPLAGPGAPFWPTRREEDDPQVQVMMRAKYRRTVNTQTTTQELVRVEALEERLASMEVELAESRQSLTDTRVQLEVEHRKSLESEIEMARKTAVERNRFLQEKFEVKVEQLRQSERSKVSNLEGQLRRETEESVREALAAAESTHRAEIAKLQEELNAERQLRVRALQDLERFKKEKSSKAGAPFGSGGDGDDGSGKEDDTVVRKVGLGDIVKIEYDQKMQIERAEKEGLELREQINMMATDMKHARGEIECKAKRIAELEHKVASEMTTMLREREDFEASQRALREDMSAKMARLNVELRAARRHLEDVRGDYRRERQVNDVISSRQLEVLGQLKRHNLELSERIMKLERRLSAARQLAETRGIRADDQRASVAEHTNIKFNKTDQEDEEWSRLASKRQQSNDETVVTRAAADATILESGRRNLEGTAEREGTTTLPRLHRAGFGDESTSRAQRTKRDLVPGSANILKVKDACQSMQAITGIISDYQKYLDDLLTSSISTADPGPDHAKPNPQAGLHMRSGESGLATGRTHLQLSNDTTENNTDRQASDTPLEMSGSAGSNGKLSLPMRQSRPSARRRHQKR